MNLLRNTSVVRFVAALLTVCLGAVVVSPAATAEGMGTQYADWLRLHLSDPSQPDVEQALVTASERGVRTFEEFLSSFLDELESMRKGDDLTEIDDGPQDSTERMRTELRLQYVRFVGEAIMPGFLKGEILMQATGTQNIRIDKAHSFSASHRAFGQEAYSQFLELQPVFLGLGFFRSSVQPLGP